VTSKNTLERIGAHVVLFTGLCILVLGTYDNLREATSKSSYSVDSAAFVRPKPMADDAVAKHVTTNVSLLGVGVVKLDPPNVEGRSPHLGFN